MDFNHTMQTEYQKACEQFYGTNPVNANQVGYDPVNVPGLHAVNPADENEFRYIEYIRNQVATNLRRGHELAIKHLSRPVVPTSQDPTRQAVNMLVVDKIWGQISRNSLYNFYTQDSLQELVNRVCMHDYRCFQREWGIQNIDVATDLALIAMYDVILIGDDSGSMSTTDRGEQTSRWERLKLLVQTISFWTTLMDDDGIDVRMFNTDIGNDGNNIGSPQSVDQLFKLCRPGGITPMGESIMRTIKEKKIFEKVDKKKLKKPVLFLIITDGTPTNKRAVTDAITQCRAKVKDSRYKRRAIAFGFCQVGKDKSAQEWLNEIDEDSKIGNSIDCTSEYAEEYKEFQEKGNQLTPGTYVAKMLLGPINSLYDKADEETAEGSDFYSPFVAPPYYVMPQFVQPSAPPMVQSDQQYMVTGKSTSQYAQGSFASQPYLL